MCEALLSGSHSGKPAPTTGGMTNGVSAREMAPPGSNQACSVSYDVSIRVASRLDRDSPGRGSEPAGTRRDCRSVEHAGRGLPGCRRPCAQEERGAVSAASVMRYLSLGQLMELHRRLSEETGSAAGIRDLGAPSPPSRSPRQPSASAISTVLGLADGRVAREELTSWIRDHSRERA